MFDDQNPKPASPTAGGVEDIFENTETDSVPANLPTANMPAPDAVSNLEAKPKPPAPAPAVVAEAKPLAPAVQTPASSPTPTVNPTAPTMPTTMGSKSSGSGIGKIIMIVVTAILIIALSGFLAYKFIMQAPTDNIVEDTTIEEVDESDADDTEVETDDTTVDEVVEDIDSDGDGLTDAEEIEVGTDVKSTDTDKDGLGDREEVQVYGTDPLDADSDGDGFLDGQEVSGGYNPNGVGKLLELPK